MKARKTLAGFFVSFVIIYLIILVSVYVFQGALLYFPRKYLEASPLDAGLQYETILYEAEDGVKISAWYIPCEGAEKAILFCHGNAGNISHRIDSIKIFYQLGFNVFIFDYRGYGQSRGKPSEKGLYRDVKGAWDYLIEKKNFREDQIVLFGRSLGGTVASWMAARTKPGALIVESAFTSVPDLARKIYPFLPVRLLCRHVFAAIDYVKQVKCPVLVVHSPDDELIPFKHGQLLFEAAPAPKEMLTIRGSHNQGFYQSHDIYTKGLKKFLDNISQ